MFYVCLENLMQYGEITDKLSDTNPSNKNPVTMHVCGHKEHQDLRNKIWEKMLYSHLKLKFINTYSAK
jgi:hypothetical protein